MAEARTFSRGGSQSKNSMSRIVSVLSLDGDRLSAELVVRFHRALSGSMAESVTNEIARTTAEVLGEQISQGAVPLTKEELVERVNVRVSAGATKLAELEIRGLHLAGSEAQAGRSASRVRHASTPPPPRERHGSGVMPAVSPDASVQPPLMAPPPPVRTLWPGALSRCPPDASVEEIGELLGPPLRDSIAAAILHSFVAIDPMTTDRLGIVGGGSVVVSELLQELGACFATALYRTLSARDIDRNICSEIVRVAGRYALAPEDFSDAPVSHYLASDAPVRDLATRMAAAIVAPEAAPVIQAAISPYCSAVRGELIAIAAQVRTILAGT